MAPKGPSRAKEPAPKPADPWEWIRRELLIAASVAASLTVLLVIRRWATLALGHGILNQEIFTGDMLINDLIGKVEDTFTAKGGGSRGERRTTERARADRATVSDEGGPDDDASE